MNITKVPPRIFPGDLLYFSQANSCKLWLVISISSDGETAALLSVMGVFMPEYGRLDNAYCVVLKE